jgi:hypothetical protein
MLNFLFPTSLQHKPHLRLEPRGNLQQDDDKGVVLFLFQDIPI